MHETNAANRGAPGQLPLPEADRIRFDSIKRIAACEQNQQLIGRNPQLMRISDNSGHQSAVPGVVEADVASLSSEATARCSDLGEGIGDHTEPALILGALCWAWRYHHLDSESGMGVAWASNDARQSDEATEQGDEADER